MKDKVYYSIGIILILATLGVVWIEGNPAFYDPLGFISFTFLIGLGIYMLRNPKTLLPRWVWFILIMMGAVGIIIDGSIVLREFILK